MMLMSSHIRPIAGRVSEAVVQPRKTTIRAIRKRPANTRLVAALAVIMRLTGGCAGPQCQGFRSWRGGGVRLPCFPYIVLGNKKRPANICLCIRNCCPVRCLGRFEGVLQCLVRAALNVAEAIVENLFKQFNVRFPPYRRVRPRGVLKSRSTASPPVRIVARSWRRYRRTPAR
jgi:hypothetical protein